VCSYSRPFILNCYEKHGQQKAQMLTNIAQTASTGKVIKETIQQNIPVAYF
jgi:hypothetical protein